MIFQNKVGFFKVKDLLATWTCACDGCGAQAKKRGSEPGDAADNARKEGFKTYGATASIPARWLCSVCQDKK